MRTLGCIRQRVKIAALSELTRIGRLSNCPEKAMESENGSIDHGLDFHFHFNFNFKQSSQLSALVSGLDRSISCIINGPVALPQRLLSLSVKINPTD